MVRFGPGLEKRQAVLGRVVDIGAELLMMTAVVVRARMLEKRGGDEHGAVQLADTFCLQARRRIGERFRSLFRNDDVATAALSGRFLAGEFTWLERGVVSLDQYRNQVEAAAEAAEVDGAVEASRNAVAAGR
jgi:hypothetical protein